MGINHRGSEVVVEMLANGLAKKHQVTVIQGGIGEIAKYQIERPLRLTKVPKGAPQNIWEKILFRLSLDPLSSLVKLFTEKSIEKIRQIDPDLIIPINGSIQLNILRKNFPDKKYVVFGHAGIGYHDKSMLKSKPDLFIALSPTAKKWAQQHAAPPTKVVYLPNPISGTYFQNARSTDVKIAKPVVISVGALSKYKNHDLTIMAVAQTKASLIIVGEGEEERGLKSLAAKLLKGRCRIIAVNPDEMPGLYKSADVFCLMSEVQESFGLVYLEAMSAGLPIVAPNDQIRRSIIGKNGSYATYEVSDIAAKITSSIGKKPINYIQELQKYDFQIILQKLDVLLNEEATKGDRL